MSGFARLPVWCHNISCLTQLENRSVLARSKSPPRCPRSAVCSAETRSSLFKSEQNLEPKHGEESKFLFVRAFDKGDWGGAKDYASKRNTWRCLDSLLHPEVPGWRGSTEGRQDQDDQDDQTASPRPSSAPGSLAP